MQLSFIAACNGLPLAKTFTATESKPYPLVTEVDSHHVEVTTIDEAAQTIIAHANAGHCLLKGPLKKQLRNESRKGKTDRNAYSDLLVLDVDGLTLPQTVAGNSQLTKLHLEHIANVIVSELPPELHNVSYIAQASASFGMKPTYSLHLFFMLSVPMPPKSIKLWLQHTNHTSEIFESQIQLSVNGLSLKYPLDASVADNSKLIFIAPPAFVSGVQNPFQNNDDRIIIVHKEQETLDLASLMSGISREICYELSKRKKAQLRKDAGMSRKTENIQIAQVNYRNEEILTNPDKVSITISDDSSSPFIRCNINGGDSNAYYFNLESPTYMYNFKDEPIFEIEKADKDFYLSIFEMIEESENSGVTQGLIPLVMRAKKSDVHFCGIFDPNTGQFTDKDPITPLAKSSIESFMLSHGRLVPDYVPDCYLFFDPTSDAPATDISNVPYTVNTFRKTKYMLQSGWDEEPLGVGTGIKLKTICPTIYGIMHHMLGNVDEEFERFLNWFAYIFKTRKKTGVAWVLTGVQGTGKGVFYSKILNPLFGTEHAPMKALHNIEEQFNDYMRSSVFLVVDEFHMSSASIGTLKMADKLKTTITEKHSTVRAMRANQEAIINYTNFIFLSNRLDAITLEEVDDRRYNVGTRQETSLRDARPDLVENIDEIDNELQLFASVLQTYQTDAALAHLAVLNDSKTQMRRVSMSVFEEFCQAIKQGDVAFFSDVLQIDASALMGAGDIMNAQRFVKTWIADCQHEFTIIPAEHLRTVFHAMTEQTPRLNNREFAKRLDKYGIERVRKRQFGASRNANPVSGVVINWKVPADMQQELIDSYFSEKDTKALVA